MKQVNLFWESMVVEMSKKKQPKTALGVFGMGITITINSDYKYL